MAASVVAALATTAPAQLQFAELGKRHLPATQNTWSIAHGDVDGDGDQDLVLGQHGQNRLLLNDGSGIFSDATAVRMPLDNDFTRGVALGDIDGDGDLDIVCANQGTQDRIYRNDGTGTFTDVTTGQLPSANGSQNVSLADVDGDGDLDIALAAPDRLYLNNGSGSFIDVTATHLPAGGNSWAFAFADVDGDGDLDVALAGIGGQSRLYANSGSGVFTDVTTGQLPSCWGTCVAFGDIDGDSDTDLVCGGYSQPPRLLVNNGAGSFTDVTASQMPNTWLTTRGIQLGDVDGDGDLDLVIAHYAYYGLGQDRLYLNDGSGRFTDATATQLPPYWDAATCGVVDDFDGDGDADIVFGTNRAFTHQDRFLLNDGNGEFSDTTRVRLLPIDVRYGTIQPGDLDGDGNVDLLMTDGYAQSRLALNDGSGSFSDATAMRLPVDSGCTAAGLGDVDNDGDIDIVLGRNGQSSLYVNTGAGHFVDATASHLPAIAETTAAVVLGDLDGDGDLDIVMGNMAWSAPFGSDRLYFNNGNGHFSDVTAGRLPTDTDSTGSVALGDVDGDGHLDILIANSGQDRLYLNNGLGFFTDATSARLPVDSDSTTSVTLGDIDGDGDLDLVAGNWPQQNRLYVNNGSGFFTDTTLTSMPVDNDHTSSIALGDIDEDGDLDLVLGSSNNVRTRVYRNHAGCFTDVTARLLPPDSGHPTQCVALADLDADGDLDLVVGKNPTCTGPWFPCTGGQDHLYLNLHHQLGAPHLLRCGQPFTVEAYSRYGPAGTTDFAVAYLSTTRLAIPVPPFGTLGIDPIAPLPLIAIPQPAGVGSTTWNVPNAPTLAGLQVYAQALLLNLPLQARLTNITADVLIR